MPTRKAPTRAVHKLPSSVELGLSVPRALHKQLVDLARADERSLAATVRLALRAYIEARGIRPRG